MPSAANRHQPAGRPRHLRRSRLCSRAHRRVWRHVLPRRPADRILAHGIKLTLAGVIIGTLCSLLLTRFLASILFRVAMSDPLTYTTVAVLLTAGYYIPARRASRIDPAIALHHD
jgi:hypothetical protein